MKRCNHKISPSSEIIERGTIQRIFGFPCIKNLKIFTLFLISHEKNSKPPGYLFLGEIVFRWKNNWLGSIPNVLEKPQLSEHLKLLYIAETATEAFFKPHFM